MFANFLIGLREGLEASLVISILVAYLVKSDRRHLLKWIWLGVVSAVALSVGFTLYLGFQSRQLDFRSQEILGGTMSLLAAAFVTWMVFWMARAAKGIARNLRGRIDDAADSPLSLVVIAFLAVGREGMETAGILWTNTRNATGRDMPDGFETNSGPLIAAIVGILVAMVLGWFIYRGALTINLTRFFTWTGAVLIVVAAGVLSYGVKDLQEAGVLPGAGRTLFDISAYLNASSWYGSLLAGLFNFTPSPSVLEGLTWVLYVVPVMALFLWVIHRRSAAPKPAPQPVSS
ncbi:iron uptake transporter permease EfeU [Nocardioides sp. InS609-2]|uniref:iron uptake transporter permease EfeU n=1 Tax=Nocardioides sp. InS609-2 TaxID=2760705 RepID=UPI0020BF9DDC|nr:iron uptake transporter permease EfeU [Nocardioides sp. InS609-2]